MGEWKQCKLKDICKTNASSYSSKDNYSFVNYLDTGNITQNVIDEVQFIDIEKDKLPSRAKRKVKYNSILYSTVRPNQLHYGIIKEQPENFLVSTGFTVIDVDEKMADADFIYYYLTQYEVTESMQAIGEQSTSAYPSIKASDLEDLDICLPPLEVQKKIASFLKSLDVKMIMNNKINNNLLEQLFSLYNNLMSTSQDVQEVTLSSLCHFQEGYVNPSQSHPEYFDGDVKWLRAVDINESFIIDTSRTLTQLGFESAKKSALLFKPNTIAISKSGTIGRLGIVADYMCGNRAVINISPNASEHLAFIYCFLKSKQQEFPDMAVGSVQQNLYVSLLEPLIVLIPSEKKLSDFNSTGAALLNTIQNNCVENIKLSSIRDSLLPKLMSGEIDVSTVNV